MSESDSELIVERRGGVLRIVLNRPKAANAVTVPMRDAIIEALSEADRNPEVRAVSLSAVGKHFCSGADVSLISGASYPGDGMKRIMNGAQRLVGAIYDCSKPVVCSVQGTALGMGAHMAFASDIVVASEDASFVEVFVTRGITVDAGGAWLLPRLVGLQKAKELIYFGDKISAEEACSLGLVNKAVSASELDKAADGYLDRLEKSPTTALSFAKRQLNRAFESDRASAFVIEAMAQEINSRTDDAGEGIKSFLERRPPNFKGV